MQTIIGQFEDIPRAHAAIDALLHRKYDRADISYVGSDVSGGLGGRSSGSGVLGLLVGLSSFAVPVIGPVLAAGPLAVGLAGMTASAVQEGGHWLGHAIDPSITGPDAMAYGDLIRRGGALVLVRAQEDGVENITGVLEDSGALTVAVHKLDPRS